MVEYKNILTVIDDYVIKCEITLKQIRADISPILKEITDTEEEYEQLMEYLPRYYRDHYRLDHETILLQDYDGKQYLNEDGEYSTVETPTDAMEKGVNDGLLFGFHNHPNDCCFKSLDDYKHSSAYNIKYGVTVARDGISISKNVQEIGDYTTDLEFRISNSFSQYESGLISTVIGLYPKEFDNLQIKLNEGSVSEDEVDSILMNHMVDYLKHNSADEHQKMSTRFERNDVPISVHYIPITR